MPSGGELRDAAIAAEVAEVLRDDPVLREMRFALRVHGGVAHVSGRVPNAAVRERLRRVIGRVRGVNAVWERVQIDDAPLLRVLDLGCGNRKQLAEAIGVDRHRHAAVDVIAHLERGLPFADDSVDQVYAIHVLEHVHDLLHLMNEVHRVLRRDGVLHVMVPHWQCVNAVADPTHCRLFHRQTFKFFCRPYPGLRPFRQLVVGESREDLFADLQPLKGEAAASETELARFFD